MLNNIVSILDTDVVGGVGAYESIATVTVGAGGASNVTFSNIPQTYQHLQVRGIARCTTDNGTSQIRFNSDSGANYTQHALAGSGSSAVGSASTGATAGYAGYVAQSNSTANTFGVCVIDILDYTNTNKYTTIRSFNGSDHNDTSGYIVLSSSLWLNAAAVSTIVLNMNAGNYAQYSQFALYGIK